MKANGAIYVAGHRGLVGGAICRALQEQGYTNPITGTHGELDLTEQLQVRQFFTAKRPAYVVLAAPKAGKFRKIPPIRPNLPVITP